MGIVEAVCTSKNKGTVKKGCVQVAFKKDWGIDGDAHAGPWHRQVSLLAGESIDLIKETLPSLKIGAFAENIVTRGLDLDKFPIGSQLRIGAEVILEITQIGKQCHNSGCVIKRATGDCIMPREGLFARVVQGGEVKPNDKIEPI